MQRANSSFRTGVHVLAIGCVTWLLTLAVAPNLHQKIHFDATAPEHSCAVSAYTSGAHETPENPQIVFGVAPAIGAAVAVEREPVRSFYLSCRLLEHAPPA